MIAWVIFSSIRVMYVKSNTLGKVLILYILYTQCIMSSLLVGLGFDVWVNFRMSFEWSSLLFFPDCLIWCCKTPEPLNPLNLKNPASQITPRHIKHAHNTESNTGGTQDVPETHTILCFMVVQVHMVEVLLLVWNFCYWWSWVIYWAAVWFERREGVQSSSPVKESRSVHKSRDGAKADG